MALDGSGLEHAEVCVGRKRLYRRLPPGASARDAKRVEAELRRALHAHRPGHDPNIPGDPLLSDLLADYTERHATHLRSPETAKFHAYRIGRWMRRTSAS
jgi:hypothetical protein